MFVIEVIPLKRGIGVESLSYYSACSYEPGTLITIPLRNQEVTAVVLDFKPVSVAKTALKTATFSLRKLPIQTNTTSLPQSIVATAKKMSEEIPATLGAILFALLPPEIRNGERLYPKTISEKNTEDTTPHVLADTTENRFIAYRSMIRETFAHRGSVLFIVPSSSVVAEAKRKLETGIENRVITFTNTHTVKQLQAAYEAFEDQSHAKLIIATPSYSFLDRHDITTIIVEGAGSTQYQQKTRPYLDIRDVLKQYAKQTGRSILLADTVPRTEDEAKRRDDIYATYGEHTMRLSLPGTITPVQFKKKETGETFSLCTDELHEAISLSLASKGQIFLYSARRGIAPAVICYDCGYVFRCKDSGAPYSLFRTYKNGIEERWFICGTSGKRTKAADVCESCGSWRLREQGIGIQQVYDEMRKRFPKETIFLFDHTSATTHAKARKIIDTFYQTKKSILIGTAMALPYLSEPIDLSAIMSYEATRALPTWKADETIFALLTKLREITQKDIVVQLRTPEDDVLNLAAKGLLDQFYDSEIEVRKALGYPPYSTFILLSFRGTKEQIDASEGVITTALGPQEIQFYSGPQSDMREILRYGLIRIPATLWPKRDLVDKLRLLPPYIKIEVNPERIV